MGLVTCGVLNGLKSLVLNPALKGIATVSCLELRQGQLHITGSLDGLDGVPVEITCQSLIIAPDGSWVALGGFRSNLSFVQNALNSFAAGRHPMPENPLARKALAAAGRILGS